MARSHDDTGSLQAEDFAEFDESPGWTVGARNGFFES